MTLLTHSRKALDRAGYFRVRRNGTGTAAGQAHLAMIKRFGSCVVTVLAAGAVVAAIIALKTLIYLGRFDY
jgi:hypothetical protein